MTPPVILTCEKTGRWWPFVLPAEAWRAARTMGLTDFTVERRAPCPALH